ncbi:energy transducer TonB [Flavobacterium sp. FlaQc-57]|uniref:energy transducer TonB n=1 Tax=Flavobacterium sp. FlaQc-57 TaxID=3374186 RepID=UPI003756655E
MKHKITIPEPCHENWDEMTPKDNGRFCLSCSKTVIDFTQMLPEEIQHFFIQNQDKNICGRIRKSQLDSITIQIPSRILYTQTHYHKMFLLALFIAMGTTLFSCQDKEGNKQKIDKIEVVEDSPIVKTTSNDTIDVNNKSSKISDAKTTKRKSRSALKKEKIFSFTKTKCGEAIPYNDYYADDTVYGVMGIDVSPDYPGGKDVFYEKFRSEYEIPKKLKKSTGVIKMSFVIEKDGKLDEIKTIEDLGFETGDQAIRILEKSIKWTPGETKGKKVKTFYDLSITLELDTLNPKKRKRKFSKITSMQVFKTGESNEQPKVENAVSENDNSTKDVLSPKVASDKLVKPVPENCPEITYDNEKSTSKRSDENKAVKDSIIENEVYYMGAIVETKPSYPNGIDNFYQLFINEFKRPKETKNLQNRIIVSFVIEKDGSLSTFDFLENTDPKIKTEITRALKTLPNWVPGTQNGKKTRSKYSMPIAFEKDSSENSK